MKLLSTRICSALNSLTELLDRQFHLRGTLQMEYIEPTKPDRWPANGREVQLQAICDAAYAFGYVKEQMSRKLYPNHILGNSCSAIWMDRHLHDRAQQLKEPLQKRDWYVFADYQRRCVHQNYPGLLFSIRRQGRKPHQFALFRFAMFLWHVHEQVHFWMLPMQFGLGFSQHLKIWIVYMRVS